MNSANARFSLTGFKHDTGFRVFAFEVIGLNQTRTAFTVRTDIALARRYGIQLQELPLLCRELLDRRDEGDEKHTFTYTEEDMRLYADERAAARHAAMQKRKPMPGRSDGNDEFRSDNVGTA